MEDGSETQLHALSSVVRETVYAKTPQGRAVKPDQSSQGLPSGGLRASQLQVALGGGGVPSQVQSTKLK